MRAALACTAAALWLATAARAENPVVVLETSMGEIAISVFAERVPATAENFLAYVDAGFYDGTIFHRVVPGFIVQGGGFTPDLLHKPTRDAIVNEADSGLPNLRATVAMARRSPVDSATSQFFINLVDNPFLDHGARDFGYAVFGSVIRGMDVVDAIAAVETREQKGHPYAPLKPVVILHARRRTPLEPGDDAP